MPQVAQLAIYQTISTNWTNSGGSVEQAYNWWINGGMLDTTAYPSLSTTTDGFRRILERAGTDSPAVFKRRSC